MNREDYEQFTRKPALTTVAVEELGGPDRTLLYGYTIDRASWHVYLKDGLIHRHIYDLDGTIEHVATPEFPVKALVPDKRVYPHATDAGFARLLQERGVDIPWTTFLGESAEWVGFYPHAKVAETAEEAAR